MNVPDPLLTAKQCEAAEDALLLTALQDYNTQSILRALTFKGYTLCDARRAMDSLYRRHIVIKRGAPARGRFRPIHHVARRAM